VITEGNVRVWEGESCVHWTARRQIEFEHKSYRYSVTGNSVTAVKHKCRTWVGSTHKTPSQQHSAQL